MAQSQTLCINLLHSRRHHALANAELACMCCGAVHDLFGRLPAVCHDCGHATSAPSTCCYCRGELTTLEKRVARRNRRPVCVSCRQIEVEVGR